MGRKSRYETHVKPHLSEIAKWIEDMDEKDIATKKLGIAVSTFEKYKKEHPELKDALLMGKQNLILELKASLKKKARGYHYEESKTVKIRDPENGDFVEREEIYKKYAQPDTGAIHLLLKNLDPKWRNDDRETMDLKKKQVELTERKIEQSEW